MPTENNHAECCECCRFWKLPRPNAVHVGHCHRNPPVVNPNPDGGVGFWPRTLRTDFCGEFQPKEADRA